jgi:hypothetical protein
MLLTLINCLLGAVCGTWFRVQALIPLIPLACLEEAMLTQTGSWWSLSWHAAMLMTAMEIGYLLGSSGAVLCFTSEQQTLSADLAEPA